MRRTGIFLAIAGAGWVSYQVHHAYHHFYNILPSDVLELEHKIPEYIYQPTYSGRAQVEAFWLPRCIWWWKSVPSSLAWRLLSVAQNGTHRQRLKAVHSLALLENLEDSDYYQLAQACDVKTAIGLARIEGVNLNLFLRRPNYPPPTKKEDLIDSCHELLAKLNNNEAHECVQYFVSEVLTEVQDRNAQYSTRINEEYLLLLCLKSILHHSNVPNHSNEIIRLGGLKLLMDVYYHYPDSVEMVSIVGKIISNICEPKHAKKMLLSGWIGVLAKWMSSTNVMIKLPAAKALANLDVDDLSLSSFKGGVYLLHPSYRDRTDKTRNVKADVVFVHGLLGGVFWTWRLRDKTRIDFSKNGDENQMGLKTDTSKGSLYNFYEDFSEKISKFWSVNISGHAYRPVLSDCPISARRELVEKILDLSACVDDKDILCPKKDVTKCWPVDWLAKDCPNLRIIGLNYDTYISLWMPVCPEETLHTSLEERSVEFIRKLKEAGIGKRPVIWVTHSMGGLIVKNILVKAMESNDEEMQRLCKNTKGIVFYSVPHFGSHIANLKQATKMLLLPSNEVKELSYNSPELLNLHERFLKLLRKFPVDVLSFAEAEPTVISSLRFQYRLVTLYSADPGVGEFFEIPSNHLDICKPSNRKSFLYQKVLTFIENVLKIT